MNKELLSEIVNGSLSRLVDAVDEYKTARAKLDAGLPSADDAQARMEQAYDALTQRLETYDREYRRLKELQSDGCSDHPTSPHWPLTPAELENQVRTLERLAIEIS
jgi:hypothetical protein